MDHPETLQSLTLGTLTTAQSLRVQKHIFDCPACLKLLIEIDMLLAISDAEAPPRHVKPDMEKPLYIRHDTADGFIYSRVERRGKKWVERHGGEQPARAA